MTGADPLVRDPAADPPVPDPDAGPCGWYVTIKRTHKGGHRICYALGPEATFQAAKDRIPEAQRLAGRVDPRTFWDTFGVWWVQAKAGAELAPGVLNHLAGTPDPPETITCYTHTTEGDDPR